MTRSFHTSVLFLVLVPALLFGAPGDVPLAPVPPAPMSIHSIAMASSGDGYLVVVRRSGDVYWQRVLGDPLDSPVRRFDLENITYDPHVVWTGSDYAVFLKVGNDVHMARVSEAGSVSIVNLGSLGVLVGAASSGGETALLTSWTGGYRLTVFDPAGNILRRRSSLFSGPSGLFRTDAGWRRLLPVFEGDRLMGHGVFNAETNQVVIPLVGGGGFADVTPSPEGGVLFHATDSGQLVVIDDAENIHRIDDLPPHPEFPIVGAHNDGWTVLYEKYGHGELWRTDIDLAGNVKSIDAMAFPAPRRLATFIGLVSASAQHSVLYQRLAIGADIFEVERATIRARSDLVMGDGVQELASIASGPGVDLVLWWEPSLKTLRATRVVGGVPLDGSGIEIGGGFVSPVAVVFDGEAFVVAWKNETFHLTVRRVGLDGQLSEMVSLTKPGNNWMDLGSRGDGVALLTWGLQKAVAGSLIQRGVPGSVMTSMFPEGLGLNVPAVAFDGTNVLLAGGQDYPCQFTCVNYPTNVYARALNADGSPSSGSSLIHVGVDAVPQSPVQVRSKWIVPVIDRQGLTLVETTEGGIPLRDVRMLGDQLLESPEGPMLWSEEFRGLIGDELRPVWFEPLQIEAGESLIGPLSGGAFMLVEVRDRYYIRPVAPHALRADLGITIDRSREKGERIERIRVQHQGGDSVPSMRVGIEGGEKHTMWAPHKPEISSDRPIVNGSIAGPFSPGDVVNIVIRWGDHALNDLFFWALPEARDEDAEDNFVTLQAVERRRAVRRGEQ